MAIKLVSNRSFPPILGDIGGLVTLYIFEALAVANCRSDKLIPGVPSIPSVF
jgi:hypothetical protein